MQTTKVLSPGVNATIGCRGIDEIDAVGDDCCDEGLVGSVNTDVEVNCVK